MEVGIWNIPSAQELVSVHLFLLFIQKALHSNLHFKAINSHLWGSVSYILNQRLWELACPANYQHWERQMAFYYCFLNKC